MHRLMNLVMLGVLVAVAAPGIASVSAAISATALGSTASI